MMTSMTLPDIRVSLTVSYSKASTITMMSSQRRETRSSTAHSMAKTTSKPGC